MERGGLCRSLKQLRAIRCAGGIPPRPCPAPPRSSLMATCAKMQLPGTDDSASVSSVASDRLIRVRGKPPARRRSMQARMPARRFHDQHATTTTRRGRRARIRCHQAARNRPAAPASHASARVPSAMPGHWRSVPDRNRTTLGDGGVGQQQLAAGRLDQHAAEAARKFAHGCQVLKR